MSKKKQFYENMRKLAEETKGKRIMDELRHIRALECTERERNDVKD